MAKWKAVIRDVAVMHVLDFLLKPYLAGAVRDGRLSTTQLGLFSLSFLVLCFTISGSMARANRFLHVLFVAIGFLLAGAYIILFPNVEFATWLNLPNAGAITITAVVGAALSFLVVKIKLWGKNLMLSRKKEFHSPSKRHSAVLDSGLSKVRDMLRKAFALYANRLKTMGQVIYIGIPVMWIMSTVIAAFIFCGPASQRIMEEGAYTDSEKALWRAVPVDGLLVTVRTAPREILGASMDGIPFTEVIYSTAIFSLVFGVLGFFVGADPSK